MSKQLLDEYFQNLNVSITVSPDSKPLQFKTIEKFLEFIIKEKDFWRALNGSSSTNEIGNRFQNIQDSINISLQHADSNIDHAKNQIQQSINNANQRVWPTIYSKTPIAQFIKRQYQIGPQVAEAAIQYLLRRQLGNLGTYDYFKGYINSYIFEEANRAFNESAASQEATLIELHNEYTQQLNDLNVKHNQITTEWKNEFNTAISKWNNESEDFKNTTTTWRQTIETENKNELTSILSDLDSIRKRYTEYLRLDGPAKYRKDMEKEYNDAGEKWKWWVIGSTAGFILFLTVILLIHPDSQFIKDGVLDVNSLRNALIFTIITSVSIYLITFFVKLSISSYHLARDAKERYQLTHVYLSLLNENENSIKDNERITVLQSLFSRADTGLLKGDSGPSIPDSLSQIIKLIKK